MIRIERRQFYNKNTWSDSLKIKGRQSIEFMTFHIYSDKVDGVIAICKNLSKCLALDWDALDSATFRFDSIFTFWIIPDI